MLRCAVSNVAPAAPVLGVPTGLVYERSVIEKAIAESGRCPVTNTSLKKDDLVPIKVDHPQVNPPRSLEGSSIPALLAAFQNEWDATALESFKLRQTLDKTRKELAQALYQHDAACRVIARLCRERDEARNALASVSAANQGTNGSAAHLPAAELVIPFTTEEIRKIEEVAAKLMSARAGKRKAQTASGDKLIWKPHQLHKDAEGAVCLDLNDNADLAAIGFTNGLVRTIVRSTGKVEKETKVSAPVTQVHISRDSSRKVIVATADSKLHLGTGADGSSLTIQLESASTGICEHPTHDYVFAAERIGKWSLFRTSTGQLAVSGRSTSTGPMLSIDTHPDGKVFATGGNPSGAVSVWDLLSGSHQADLAVETAKDGAARFLAFSENGVSLAVGHSNGGVVNVWDMRKATSPVHTFQSAGSLCAVAFDPSGQTLLTAYDNGSMFVRNVLRTGAWPVSFESPVSTAGSLLAASPGAGSCLTLSRDGVLAEWR